MFLSEFSLNRPFKNKLPVVIEITFIILFTVPILVLCSGRGSNDLTREKSDKEEPSLKSSKRARPLEPEELIPLAEGSEKNPDVGEMITERSKKSAKLKRSQKMKGFVMEKDRSVRRLENRSKYEAKTSARYKRSAVVELDPYKKSAKSPKNSKKSEKSNKKSKISDRPMKPIDDKKTKPEVKSEKKKSVISEKKQVKDQNPKEEVNKKENEEGMKTKQLKKNRNPLKKLFQMKRKKARNDVHVVERNGTWA